MLMKNVSMLVSQKKSFNNCNYCTSQINSLSIGILLTSISHKYMSKAILAKLHKKKENFKQKDIQQ